MSTYVPWQPPKFEAPIIAEPPLWADQWEEYDPELQAIVAPLSAVTTLSSSAGFIDGQVASALSAYQREHPYAVHSQQFVDARFRHFIFCIDRYQEGIRNQWELYHDAERMATLSILDPTQYMVDLGEYAFKGSCDYFQALGDAGHAPSDVRLKHLMGAYEIAVDFFKYGLDVRGEKLKHVSEVIFNLIPVAGDLSGVFLHNPEGLHELLMLERLFGSVVDERYSTLYKQALENEDVYAAMEILEIQALMGKIGPGIVESFLVHPVFTGQEIVTRHAGVAKFYRLFPGVIIRDIYDRIHEEYEAYFAAIRRANAAPALEFED